MSGILEYEEVYDGAGVVRPASLERMYRFTIPLCSDSFVSRADGLKNGFRGAEILMYAVLGTRFNV